MAKRSRKTRSRGPPARRGRPNATSSLAGALVGDRVEWFSKKNNLWYGAEIKARRTQSGQAMEICILFDGSSKKSKGRWVSVDAEIVRSETTDANNEERHLSNFAHQTGHITGDTWEVECLLDERGIGAAKEYLVRWLGWAAAYDSWLAAAQILDDSLIAAYESARDAERIASEQAARDARAPYARSAIGLLRSKLLTLLRKAKESKRRLTITGLEECDEWKFKAIHEYLTSIVPEGDDVAEHLTPISHVQGASGRGKTVESQFEVRSHKLLALLINCEDEEPRRAEHVALKTGGEGKAVAMLPPVKFSRYGPRLVPHLVKLRVKAGFGALVARDGEPPDWRFENDVCVCVEEDECECEAIHYAPIAGRVVDIYERTPGLITNEEMIAECNEHLE